MSEKSYRQGGMTAPECRRKRGELLTHVVGEE
jgi:hypothetical protein